MLKLLLVVSNNLMHGTERYALELAENLPKDKYDVYIATPSSGPLSDLIKKKNLKEIVYHNGSFNKFTLKGSINLFKEIKRHKFDIIHANSGIIPCIIGKLLRIKLCIEIKHGVFYSNNQLEKISKLNFFKEYIKQNFVDFFIAISENDKQRLIKFFKIKADKIKVVYNGLNTNEIDKQIVKDAAAQKNNSNGKIVIGTIGRYNYQKAYDVLVEAVDLVVSEKKSVQFYFIGTGEEESKIKQLVKDKNLEQYITFIGYTKEIFKYLRSFDIFVLTSRYEGVPYVILEAMYMEIPIICTRVGGIDNILTNNENALITESDSPILTSQAIFKMVSNPDLRKKLSKNSKELIKLYTSEKMAKNTSNLYIDFLKNNFTQY